MKPDDVKSAAKGATDTAASTARDMGSNAQAYASDAIDRGHGLANQASDKASELYGQAKEHVAGLSDRLPNASGAYQAGQRVYAQSSEHVGRHVAKQPIEALLLAGAIGYLVGWATSRS